MDWQDEAEEIHSDEEAAGDQEVHHIHGRVAPNRDLQQNNACKQTVNLRQIQNFTVNRNSTQKKS